MKISALRLFNVKRFAGRGVAIEGIGDGVNVLCAPNEFGKSTSFDALHALFFQPHTGTPNEVRRLQPYSGGSPQVEADILTGEGHFRIAKRYYGGKSASVTDLATGRLVAQADEAENFVANLIKGGTAGPAGLLWVRQGVTGIEPRKKSEEEAEQTAREGLLNSVQSEVEAVTGGRRMADIMAACEKELAQLVTARTAKPAGRYAAAIDHRDQLAADAARLASEVTRLRQALDQRTKTTGQLAELEAPEQVAVQQAAIVRAQAAHDTAKIQGEALKAAEAGAGLLRERRDAAMRALGAWRENVAAAGEMTRAHEAALSRRDDAKRRRRVAGEAVAKATAEADAHEAAERENRDLLDRLRAAIAARENAEQLGELTKRLADAEAARAGIEAGEADLNLLELPPKSVGELQTLEVDIAGLRAALDASRPTVAVAYESGAAGKITLDGRALGEGEEAGFDGQAKLAMDGVGVVTLRSNATSRSDDRLEKALEKRRGLLATMGVADLAAALSRQAESQRRRAEVEGQRTGLRALAPDGIAALRDEVARRSASAGQELELKGDPGPVKAALAAAELGRLEARAAHRAAAPLEKKAIEDFVAAESALVAALAGRERLDALLGPEDQRRERETALAVAAASADAAFRDAETRVAALRGGAVDIASAEAALKRARSADEAAKTEIGRLREALAGLNAQIRRDADGAIEEDWREAAEKLGAATMKVDGYAREVTVLQRLRDSLQAARSAARDQYMKPVMTELKPLLGLLFDDVSITFDEKSLLPQTIRRSGQEEDVDRLSGGMREQLSVLTRLAFARLLARDGRPAPVILDDALVYSDDDRIERMFDALHRQASDQQIIVFSCRQRAFRELGGKPLHMIEWQPSS